MQIQDPGSGGCGCGCGCGCHPKKIYLPNKVLEPPGGPPPPYKVSFKHSLLAKYNTVPDSQPQPQPQPQHVVRKPCFSTSIPRGPNPQPQPQPQPQPAAAAGLWLWLWLRLRLRLWLSVSPANPLVAMCAEWQGFDGTLSHASSVATFLHTRP